MDKYLAGRNYESIYNDFMVNEDIPLLCLGLFTNQPSSRVIKNLSDLLGVEKKQEEGYIDSRRSKKEPPRM